MSMKMLRFLFAFVLAIGLSAFAKADDFQMVVLDPTYTGTYIIHPLTDLSTFSVTFTECEEPGQLPSGADFDGCYSFQNETKITITGLDISVNGLVPGQTVGCALSSTGLDIFSDPECSDVTVVTDGTSAIVGYLLGFSGGSITPGEIVTIAEKGVDVTETSFPPTSVTPDVAPEPSSIYLLSTGICAVGSLCAQRRRRLIRTSRT
jgi:hypothetical protein